MWRIRFNTVKELVNISFKAVNLFCFYIRFIAMYIISSSCFWLKMNFCTLNSIDIHHENCFTLASSFYLWKDVPDPVLFISFEIKKFIRFSEFLFTSYLTLKLHLCLLKIFLPPFVYKMFTISFEILKRFILTI